MQASLASPRMTTKAARRGMQMQVQLQMRMAARTSSTATATALHQAPLRLIALPLCRNPDLVYYLPHKARSNDAVAIEAGTGTGTGTGKGKEKDLGAGTSTDHSTAHRERSAQTEQQSGSGGNVGGGGGSDLADRIAALVSKATNKATEQWEKFGKAKPGNWKYRIYMTGENLMDRIEYEEWLLKALDASTAPKLFTRRPHITDADADADAASTRTSADGSGSRAKSVPEPLIPLYYPEKLVSEQYVLADLRRMVDLREPHHKSLMKKSLVAAPLTFPFAIIPVVPNFPLFYVLWRAWSHWRAMKSSQYLKQLLGEPSSGPGASHLVPSASGVLAEVYSRTGGAPFASASPSSKADPQAGGRGAAHGQPEILLDHAMVDKLVEQFGLEDQARVDLRRAISQLEARLKKGQGQGQDSGR